MLFRIVNREDPDQAASLEATWSGSALFIYTYMVGILGHLPKPYYTDAGGYFACFFVIF